MGTNPLLQTTTVVLDNDGNGTTSPIGPTSQGESWNVTLISVQCSTNQHEAICSVYLNNSLLGTTTWGSTGDSDSGISQMVMMGQQITATWTGGDSGAVAQLSVMGMRTF